MATLSSFTSLSSIAPNTISSIKNNPSPASFVSFRRLQVTAAVCTTSEPIVRSTTTIPSSSLYDVLGVQTGATCKEIKAAYRRLAREVHPDVNGQRDTSADEFIKVREAYATLSDPHKRADYDRDLFLRGRFSMSGLRPMNQSGYTRPRGTRRTWETDQCW